MNNNLHKVRNVMISDGSSLPANNSAYTTTSVPSGKLGIYGVDMTALDPGGSDTVSTQPSIYVVQGKTDTDGNSYIKRSNKITATNVTGWLGKSYTPATREVWAIGYNRKTATGTITATSATDYNFSIRFKHDKHLGSERPILFNYTFRSDATATQLTIATQISNAINNSSFKTEVVAIVVGDGTSVYGVTGATNFGVEITGKDIEQFAGTNYNIYRPYFSVHVNDSTGFDSTTTCTQIQANSYGIGTYAEVKVLEDFAFGYEGVLNRRLWPIPVLDYSVSSSYVLSAAIVPTVACTSGEDKVTFSATVAAILRAGEKVELAGVNYEIKYFISSTVAILTSVTTATLTTGAAKVRGQYDMFYIDFDDTVSTPTGIIARANKEVTVAIPTFDAGGAYSSNSSATTDFLAILNPWMIATPARFSNVSV